MLFAAQRNMAFSVDSPFVGVVYKKFLQQLKRGFYRKGCTREFT
jgi:hypothetical protein